MKTEIQEKKAKLESELRKLEEQEEMEAKQGKLEKNYLRFLAREKDEIIWFAHCDIEEHQNDSWRRKQWYTIWDAISISGNCGTTYKATANITSSTYAFFHNVWTDKQRRDFQNKLNDVAIKEIKKIMSDLSCVLEIMWLQANDFYIRNIYPEDKKQEILSEIEKWQKEVLDTYSDEDFLWLIKNQTGRYNMDTKEPVEPYLDTNLSHSNNILYTYVRKYRPSLHTEFKKTKRRDVFK